MTESIIPEVLYGHERVREALRSAAERRRLHHTLLFSGPDGVGKRTTAILLAQMVMCERFLVVPAHMLGGCNQCHHCKLVRVGHMPDLIVIDCSDRDQCSTDAVKELLTRLRLRSFSGAARFLIFDNAHHLQGQAANALLKSLEEPRPGTYFALVTDKPQLMLRTIHSRSQRWGFGRLSDVELRAIIESRYCENRSARINSALLELANGSLALYDLFSDFEEDVLTLKNQLEQIAQGDAALALELGSLLAQTKEGLSEKIVCMNSLARHFLITTQELRWAQFLQDIGELEYFLFRRNFAPLYILQNLFLNLAREEVRTLYDENFISQQLEQL